MPSTWIGTGLIPFAVTPPEEELAAACVAPVLMFMVAPAEPLMVLAAFVEPALGVVMDVDIAGADIDTCLSALAQPASSASTRERPPRRGSQRRAAPARSGFSGWGEWVQRECQQPDE